MLVKIIILVILIIEYNCENCGGVEHCADCLVIPGLNDIQVPQYDYDCKNAKKVIFSRDLVFLRYISFKLVKKYVEKVQGKVIVKNVIIKKMI